MLSSAPSSTFKSGSVVASGGRTMTSLLQGDKMTTVAEESKMGVEAVMMSGRGSSFSSCWLTDKLSAVLTTVVGVVVTS